MISKEQFCEKAEALITEEDRKQYNKCKKRTRILLGVILPCIAVAFVMLAIFVSYGFAIIGIMVLIIGAKIICSTSGFKWNDFKNKHSLSALNILLDDYQYNYNAKNVISPNIFRASKFAWSFDNYTGEDLIKINIKNDDGTPSNVAFSICDLYVTETRTRTVRDKNGGSHTEEYTVTVYRGAFGYVKFPFSFKCGLDLNIDRNGHDRIKLEDIDFNKRFSIYTDNQIEALCILTPTMMTKLKELDKRVKDLKISLKNNMLYIGFARNIFEMNKKVKKLDGSVFSRYYDDVNNLYGILEEIKNNNKVFKM